MSLFVCVLNQKDKIKFYYVIFFYLILIKKLYIFNCFKYMIYSKFALFVIKVKLLVIKNFN